MAEATKRYAVVTGANKGIGLEICRKLASNKIVVILTDRDEKRGLEAFQKLKDSGLSGYVVFHQLDVVDEASVNSLADFIKTQFGKLDILVNNAGILGVKVDIDTFRAAGAFKEGQASWKNAAVETYELGEECLKINYYGAKRMVDALIPLLQLSDSPRIVNVSSSVGQLKIVSHKWAVEVLGDTENLTEDRVEEVLNQYLKDVKEGSLEAKGWPALSAYIISKAAMNAYTRILAKKYPTFGINCVCPGYVKTDINFNDGILSVEEGAESPVWLALMPNGGPTGCFFIRKEKTPF